MDRRWGKHLPTDALRLVVLVIISGSVIACTESLNAVIVGVVAHFELAERLGLAEGSHGSTIQHTIFLMVVWHFTWDWVTRNIWLGP